MNPLPSAMTREYLTSRACLTASGFHSNAARPGGSLESPTAHLAALGFLSDLRFVWAGLASHRANHETAQIASLDHQIYFHQPSVDATAIHLYEMDSPYAAFGRTLVRGHIWELKSKRLVASTVQEGVLRVNCASSLDLPPNKGRIRGRL